MINMVWISSYQNIFGDCKEYLEEISYFSIEKDVIVLLLILVFKIIYKIKIC